MQRLRFLKIRLQHNAIPNYFFSSFFPEGENFEFYHRPTYELGNDPKKIVLTCEHASNDLPHDYTWEIHDEKKYKTTHWAYDIKAWDLTKELALKLNIVGFGSKYSRLFCDVNRPITSDTLFRDQAEKDFIHLNHHISKAEEKKRLEKYYLSYHQGLRYISMKINPEIVVSIHSFTPVYEGKTREVEVGILTSFNDELGLKLLKKFQQRGYKADLNEPWSGKEGFCYANDCLILARSPKRKGVMVEFRNDLLLDDKKFTTILHDFSQFLEEILKKK